MDTLESDGIGRMGTFESDGIGRETFNSMMFRDRGEQRTAHGESQIGGREPGTYWILTALPVSTCVPLAKSPGDSR